MSHVYQAPVALLGSALVQAAEAAGADCIEGYETTQPEITRPVLEAAARFAAQVLSPLNRVGDAQPAYRTEQGVHSPPGFTEAYRRFRADGWVGLGAPQQFGGQGLPLAIEAAVTEMWAGANFAFATCPELASGALEALHRYGSESVREVYAARIASGEWAAAMALTEPQAGSDLSLLRCRATPDGPLWRISGRKQYISWGDHDLTENIVHFVLARTPDAPPGLNGISLFLVPKCWPGPDGKGLDNDVRALSVEHKMGLRASPTCLMAYGERDGARGWLIGERNAGLTCMFTLMNRMRLGVGLHSLGLAERALQLARAHARERIQGRGPDGAPCPIIQHADVRRMLLAMKALTHASRGLAYTAAATLDVARLAPQAAERARAQRRAELLTPLVKAWCSDVAVEVASLGVQIHGGSGYIDGAEISQVYRDARIGPIFEGTNYIQAQDLLGRKVLRDDAVGLRELLATIQHAAAALPEAGEPGLDALRTGLLEGSERLLRAAAALGAHDQQRERIGASAHHFLNWLGLLAGGWQWALSARRALAAPADAARQAVLDTATFFATQLLPRSLVHEAAIRDGWSCIDRACSEQI
jgi:acyl-CoA dehydrogenase